MKHVITAVFLVEADDVDEALDEFSAAAEHLPNTVEVVCAQPTEAFD
jgi:hypothetical protein